MPIKTDSQEKISLYEGEKKRPLRSGKWLLSLLLVLLGLLSVHFVNVYLQWSVVSRELARKPAFNSPNYTFFGFYPFNKKEIAAAQRLPNAGRHGRIYGYFDLFHPAVFLVWNNGREDDFFDLGPVIVAVPAGASRVSFLPGSVFYLRQGKRSVVRHFGGAMIGRLWQDFVRKTLARSAKGRNGASGSFVVKELEKSRYLKIPFLIYFFAPLLIIAFMINTWGAAMAAAFFYYVEMFLLFDFQKLFVTAPFSWSFATLKIEVSDFWILTAAVILALFFLAGSIYGLRHWRGADAQPARKWAVIFFVLLPFALFF